MKVEYKGNGEYAIVSVDGKQIRCSGFEYSHYVGEIPKAVLEIPTVNENEIEGLAEVGIRIEPKSVDEALEIVKAYLKANSRYETVSLLQGVVDDIRKGGRVISKNSEK